MYSGIYCNNSSGFWGRIFSSTFFPGTVLYHDSFLLQPGAGIDKNSYNSKDVYMRESNMYIIPLVCRVAVVHMQHSELLAVE